MLPHNLIRASLAVAMLVFGSLHGAEESSDVPLSRATSEPALRLAGAPIAQAPDSHTDRDLRRQFQDWNTRRLLAPLAMAAKGQPWEAAAVKLTEDTFATWAGLDRDWTPAMWAELAARGDELIKSGCGEPTIRYLTIHARFMQNRNKRRALAEYRQLLKQLESDPRYPKVLSFLVALKMRETLPAVRPGNDAMILELERQSVEEGSYSGADDALFVNEVLSASALLKANSDAMEKLISGLQKAPEWARETLLGKIEINRAWEARGSGWGSSVTEKGWRGFNASLKKARGHLEAAWKLRPDQPFAATDMIVVAMGSETEPAASLRLWFDRAVKAQFDLEDAYDAYEWALRPRWSGSHEEMLAFGRACAATKRFDTNVPHRLIQVLDDIGGELSMRREIYRMASIPAEVVAVDKGYVAAPAPPELANVHLSLLAFDGWLCRQWSDARAALDQLPEHKLHAHLRDRMAYFGVAQNNVVGETLIHTGPAGEEYAKARALDGEDRFEEAAAHYAAALKACEEESVPRGLIKHFIKINENRIELAKGQWKNISPRIAEPGEWWLPPLSSIPQDGVLQVLGRGETTLSQWRTPVGENYEVRATFEFLTPIEQWHRFAIALGVSSEAPEESVTCDFDSGPGMKGKAYLLHGFAMTETPPIDVELGMKNRLHVQCWQGRISVYLNGKAVVEKLQPSEGVPGAHFGEIGFGGNQLTETEGFRVSDIAVRVLKAEPTPPEDGEGQ